MCSYSAFTIIVPKSISILIPSVYVQLTVVFCPIVLLVLKFKTKKTKLFILY